MATEQVTPRWGQLTPQFGWDDERIVQAARQVEDLMQHPGWQQLVEAIGTHERMLHLTRLDKQASDSAAEYAGDVGEMRGVRSLVPLAAGVVEAGHAVVQKRQNERAAEEVAREAA